jgi:hypothetical protein
MRKGKQLIWRKYLLDVSCVPWLLEGIVLMGSDTYFEAHPLTSSPSLSLDKNSTSLMTKRVQEDYIIESMRYCLECSILGDIFTSSFR